MMPSPSECTACFVSEPRLLLIGLRVLVRHVAASQEQGFPSTSTGAGHFQARTLSADATTRAHAQLLFFIVTGAQPKKSRPTLRHGRNTELRRTQHCSARLAPPGWRQHSTHRSWRRAVVQSHASDHKLVPERTTKSVVHGWGREHDRNQHELSSVPEWDPGRTPIGTCRHVRRGGCCNFGPLIALCRSQSGLASAMASIGSQSPYSNQPYGGFTPTMKVRTQLVAKYPSCGNCCNAVPL